MVHHLVGLPVCTGSWYTGNNLQGTELEVLRQREGREGLGARCRRVRHPEAARPRSHKRFIEEDSMARCGGAPKYMRPFQKDQLDSSCLAPDATLNTCKIAGKIACMDSPAPLVEPGRANTSESPIMPATLRDNME